MFRGRRWPIDPFAPPTVAPRGRGAWLIAGLLALIALAAILPAPWPTAGWAGGGSAARIAGAGGPAALLDTVVLTVASGLVWILLAWTALIALAGTVARRPGRCGRLAERVLRRVAPAAARQLFVASVSVSVGVSLIGGLTACSVPAPAAGTGTSGPVTSGPVTSGLVTSGLVPSGFDASDQVTSALDLDASDQVTSALDLDTSASADVRSGFSAVEGSAEKSGGSVGPAGSVRSGATAKAAGAGTARPTWSVALPGRTTGASVSATHRSLAALVAAAAPRNPTRSDLVDPPERNPAVGIDSRWVHPARMVGGIVRGIDVDWPGPAAGSPVAAPVVVVHRGDTLWAIAARHLGGRPSDTQIDASWRTWYAANRAVIGNDPNLILPGQQLRPPAVPAVADGDS